MAPPAPLVDFWAPWIGAHLSDDHFKRCRWSSAELPLLQAPHDKSIMTSKSNPSSQVRSSDEVRCHCGQLIARIIGEGLELKCKRCRRLVIIPFASIGGWPFHAR
jgi:hypothetical protein